MPGVVEGMIQLYSTGRLENPVPTSLKDSVLHQSQALPVAAVSEGGSCAGMTLFSWLYSQIEFFYFLLHLPTNLF